MIPCQGPLFPLCYTIVSFMVSYLTQVDTPKFKTTYDASITVNDTNLVVVMSAIKSSDQIQVSY